MLLSLLLNRTFVHDTSVKLSGNALRFYIRMSWERKYPRRRIRQTNPIMDKAKWGVGLWIDDHEVSEWLQISLGEVNEIRQELIDANLVLYNTLTGVKLDRSLIGIYFMRRMY